MSKPAARKRSMSMYEVPKVVEVDDDTDEENEATASESEDDETLLKEANIKPDPSIWTLAENDRLFEEVLREVPSNDTKSYRSRMKMLNWSAIKVEGRTADECSAQMNKLFKNLRHIRTIAEIMVDAKKKNEKLKQPKKEKVAKAKATRAKSAFNVYCARLRDENKFTNLGDASDLYKKVSPEDKFELLKAAEEAKIRKYYADLEQAQTTPYTMFVREQYDKGIYGKRELKAAYKLLSPTERLAYIRLAVGEVSNQSNHQINDFSFLTNEELRMMQGGQARTPSAYNLFVRDYCGVQKMPMKDAGEAYRNLSSEELQKYKAKVEELKNAANTIQASSKKSKTSLNGNEKKKVETPAKNTKRTSEAIADEESPFKTPTKRPPKAEDVKMNGSVEKRRKLSVSSTDGTPREAPPRKIKEEKVTEPERVPTSLFQYYVQNVYTGKPKKAEKAFAKLAKDERKRIKRVFKSVVAEYMKKLEVYLKTLSKEEMNEYAKRSQETTLPAGDDESDTSFSSN